MKNVVSITPYDSIIVGAGPAGITAAIYLARKKLDILIITLDVGGQASYSTDVDNYTGYTMITGAELVKRFEQHIESFKIKMVNSKVTDIKKQGNLFRINTTKGTYEAKTVIVCSGKKPRSLKIPGEEKLIGKGITYCATCDAPFFKDKPVLVVGGGNSALQAILELAKFTKEIYLVNLTPKLTGDEILKDKVLKMDSVKVYNGCRIKSIGGDKFLEKVKVENCLDKKSFDLKVRGMIVEIGLEPSLDFKLPRGLKLTKNKEIDVDQNCITTVKGLFSAGDITDVKWKQIIIAAGEGAKAALSAYEYLIKKFPDNTIDIKKEI
jgi:alkyl hydroperoxide reductase subunit F